MPIEQISTYLQDHLGPRITATLAGQTQDKAAPDPHDVAGLRLRQGYKIARTLIETFDEKTTRAWLFGTNSLLDGQAPIEAISAAAEPAEFAAVACAASQVTTFQT